MIKLLVQDINIPNGVIRGIRYELLELTDK